ncbi:MAG: hypothetical protein HY719_02700, partial [Planctomycetes bacterium]|nr:hypothetical protein [Planctomycetota bacterium]
MTGKLENELFHRLLKCGLVAAAGPMALAGGGSLVQGGVFLALFGLWYALCRFTERGGEEPLKLERGVTLALLAAGVALVLRTTSGEQTPLDDRKPEFWQGVTIDVPAAPGGKGGGRLGGAAAQAAYVNLTAPAPKRLSDPGAAAPEP